MLMKSFEKEIDFIRLEKEGCYYEIDEGEKINVYLLMLRMQFDLKKVFDEKLFEQYIDEDNIDLWKLDIILKISISLFKLHS